MMRIVNSNEAASPIIGMILILGIVITVVGIIYTVGIPGTGIESAKERAQMENMPPNTTSALTINTHDKGFITIAAFGSPLNGNLDTLRAFRDNILITNPPGKFLVGTYYITSPPIADALSQNDILRAATRILLITPLVYISAICLNTSLFIALIILFAIILFILRRSAKVIYLLKGIGCGALTIAAFTVAVFTLGAIGYELPICAAITAYLLPVIIPASLCVCALEWIVAAKKNHKISQIHTEYI